MTHLPDSDLRELEGLLGKATPGPWKVEGAPQLAKGAQTVVTSVAPWPLEIGPSWHDWTLDVSRFVAETRTEDDSGEPDAALIVAAVNALPSLIADLRKARAEIERLKANGVTASVPRREKIAQSELIDRLIAELPKGRKRR